MQNFLAHIGHLSCINQLHAGHFAFMQDNFTDNITLIELGEIARVVSVFVLFPVMMVTEKCQ